MVNIKNVNISRYKINNVDDIRHNSQFLDQASVVKTAYAVGYSDDNTTDIDNNDKPLAYIPIDTEIGMFNVSQGKYIKSMSKGYKIIQHRDVFDAVHEAFSQFGMQTLGRMDNMGNKVKLDVYFVDDNNQPIMDDSEKGVKLGVRVLNSYDGTSAFRLEMFGIRMICQNGMTFGNLLPVREIVRHKGSEKTYDVIYDTVREFVNQMALNYSQVNKYISEMMKDKLEWNLAYELLDKLVKIKKHNRALREIIKRDYGDKPILSRYDLYNVITNYATHGEDLKNTVINSMELLSQRIMKDNVAEIYSQNQKFD